MTQFGEHTGVEKLGLSSKDWTSEHIAKIAELFPQVLTESQDEHGRLRKAINFDKLKDILSHDLAQGRESYEFTWVGKRDAMAEAGRPTTKTLRPDLAESVNFDETENVFITGDNLEVLKILQESYLNKIDMIYIDPPYNTGKDFVYSDKFQMSQEEMDGATESLDESGQRLVKNEKSNARYHSDWLNMMYPRLVLARNLLKDSGVIFISIDDNEQANLKALCDEVFGEENFLEELIWKRRATPPNDRSIGKNHEYILSYTRKYDNVMLGLLPRDENSITRYSNPDNDIKGKWVASDLSANGKGGRLSQSTVYPIKNPINNQNYYPPEGKSWLYNKEKMDLFIKEGRIGFREKSGTPFLKRYLSEVRNGITMPTILNDFGTSQTSAKELDNLMGKKSLFEFPKPVQLIKSLVKVASSRDDILIFDFFSGSCTTGDAVMQLNAEDGGHRKYILCTLDEAVTEKSVAKEAGYETIDQISRERIRRAAEKIRTESPEKVDNLDLGFKAFKLDSSNYKDVYQMPDHYQQVNLLDNISNLKDDRGDMDILFQIMLTWGMELSLSIKKENFEGTNIYNVDGNSLIACFADNLTEDVIRLIAKKEPLRVVFKDESFVNSASKINLAQIFEEVSPKTKVRVI